MGRSKRQNTDGVSVMIGQGMVGVRSQRVGSRNKRCPPISILFHKRVYYTLLGAVQERSRITR